MKSEADWLDAQGISTIVRVGTGITGLELKKLALEKLQDHISQWAPNHTIGLDDVVLMKGRVCSLEVDDWETSSVILDLCYAPRPPNYLVGRDPRVDRILRERLRREDEIWLSISPELFEEIQAGQGTPPQLAEANGGEAEGAN